MKDQHIRLRAIKELRVDEAGQPARYFIPAYQRGYRWNGTQVTQLLEDVKDFTRRRSPQPEEFYCLQPLVLLARQDGSYEVVDGQQRLTTLLLILRHFNERAAEKYRQSLYFLQYATRRDLLDFLQNPSDELAQRNVDYYHIAQATRVIETWCSAHESEVEAIKSTLLNNVKIIWFELDAGDSPVAAFTRLNVGKIPLTNAELIRALFLRNAPGGLEEHRRVEIALEWDLVEKTLQDPAFWAFLRNDTGRSGARIEFLFDLVARQQGMRAGPDDYRTFNHFSDSLAAKDADPNEIWLEVKKTCMLLEEWFSDRQLYHLVGFLIWNGMDVNILRRFSANSSKASLKEVLRIEVVKVAFGASPPSETSALRTWVSDQLEELEYPRDRRRIRSVLLLFNLASLLQHPSSNVRFHFESFKTANWDIEHVRSVASEELGSPALQGEWLRHTARYLDLVEQDAVVSALQNAIGTHLELSPKEASSAFESLYAKLLSYFHEDDEGEPDNGIVNLTLLDQETNRSYKNAVFPVKRKRVLELDAHGVFVPHCTRNVFLKSYSAQVGHAMYWTAKDRDGYRAELVETLRNFVAGDWAHG